MIWKVCGLKVLRHGKHGRNNMRILITGGAGFLGSRLAEELILKKQKVALLVRKQDDLWRVNDLKNNIKIYFSEKDTGEAFKSFRPEAIIHLATDFGRGNYDPLKMIDTNITFSVKILELCVKYKCNIFINCSTCLPSEYNLYSASKNALLEIAKYYANNLNIRFTDVVLGYMFGEKDDASKFIPYAIDSIIKGKTIKATKGLQKRDFVYVGNVANKLAEIIKNNISKKMFTRYRVSSGKMMTIRKFIVRIENISKLKAKVIWGALPYKENEVFGAGIFNNIPDIPFGKDKDIPLDLSLKKTVDWYFIERSKTKKLQRK